VCVCVCVCVCIYLYIYMCVYIYMYIYISGSPEVNPRSYLLVVGGACWSSVVVLGWGFFLPVCGFVFCEDL